MKKKPVGGMSKPGNKMTMKQYESSAMDKAMDKKMGYKEGSKKDMAADKKALNAINKKKK